MANNNKINVQVGIKDENRRYCEDFKERKGCGQEVRIRTNAAGKKVACEPEKIPCLDDEGKTVWVWVPHWATCPEQKEYTLSFQHEKSQKRADYLKSKEAAPALTTSAPKSSFRRA